jgi:hypothetical protein
VANQAPARPVWQRDFVTRYFGRSVGIAVLEAARQQFLVDKAALRSS